MDSVMVRLSDFTDWEHIGIFVHILCCLILSFHYLHTGVIFPVPKLDVLLRLPVRNQNIHVDAKLVIRTTSTSSGQGAMKSSISCDSAAVAAASLMVTVLSVGISTVNCCPESSPLPANLTSLPLSSCSASAILAGYVKYSLLHTQSADDLE